jgi:uncharacterized protein (UPF0303 family)
MAAEDKQDWGKVLEALDAEEAQLQFRQFTNDDAWRLGVQMVESARQQALPIAIDITRHGQQLFHAALAGTSADNDAWIKRKNNVVNRFGHASYRVGTQFRAKGRNFDVDSRLDNDTYAAHGGAFPIIIRHVGPVGTVTVSGLPQVEDHRFVVAELRRFLEVPE